MGLGTMVGWKRIVITVGEKIGKSHLTNGAGRLRRTGRGGHDHGSGHVWPAGLDHDVLSSGIAGTMAAYGSGLQWSAVRSTALAWVLTLPAAIILAASLYSGAATSKCHERAGWRR